MYIYVCACGRHHTRGPVNGACSFRCLSCGATERRDITDAFGQRVRPGDTVHFYAGGEPCSDEITTIRLHPADGLRVHLRGCSRVLRRQEFALDGEQLAQRERMAVAFGRQRVEGELQRV